MLALTICVAIKLQDTYLLSLQMYVIHIYKYICCPKVQHKLTEEGVYPALAESIAECLSVRREELHEKLVQDSCAISHAHLVDCDWQVKVKKVLGMH